ncbi:MauE/DoxX family redox-associated membrane protein [Kineosporia babensis]|uniref:DoxX family membrane protein n=1 Tax=Kineosporia babensis TaxID=499548 RepID=A0A9X1NE63_9ACTN|nr:DoxX family membrane protein [Kineosporia babensis]
MSKRGAKFLTAEQQRWVGPVFRLLIGGVFLYTGFKKIQDIDDTIRSVRNYQLLPEAIVPTVGSALPVVELILGVLLVAGLLNRFTAVLSFLTSLAFFIGVASAWARGLQIECGCFGNSGFTANPVPGYVRELVLNGAIMLGCVWLIRCGAGRFALDERLGLTPVPEIDAEEARSSNH